MFLRNEAGQQPRGVTDLGLRLVGNTREFPQGMQGRNLDVCREYHCISPLVNAPV